MCIAVALEGGGSRRGWRAPSGYTELALCREPELQGMVALLQRLYEIALSHMTEDAQLELEREQMD